MVRICWYCAFAFREDCSTVTCAKNNYTCKARTFCCSGFLECPKKKFVSDEQLKV
ncbi:MAG: hypothetical protein IKZ38_04190 [Clostridia bacterium]|nr:hypothetical protein [Clostridia bacterium]